MTGWEEFLHWAGRLLRDVNLNATERDYKVALAGRLATVRDRALANEPEWPEDLRRALTSANLLNRFFLMSLIDDLRAPDGQLGEILRTFWSGDPSPDALDDLAGALRPVNERYTAGNVLSLGAVLLMAQDAAAYPPFRVRAAQRWYRLTGFVASGSGASAAERYRDLLNFCDELLGQSGAAELPIADRLDAQGLAWMVTEHPVPESWNPTERWNLTVWRGEGAVDEDEPPVTDRGVGASRVLEDAAWLVLGPGLRGEPSALDPSTSTWTPETAEDLLHRVQDEPDLSKASFLTKLQRQLDGAPRSVVILAAELLFLQVIPLSNLKADTKRERIETVLSWLSPRPQLSPQMLNGLNAGGAFNGGVGFNVQIWQQLLWLARFVTHWSTQAAEIRHQGLTDPWAFQRIAAGTPQDWPSIRHSLHSLAWPGWTEAVVATEDRRRIRDAFAYRIDGASGNDEESIAKDLHAIRSVLDAEAGTRVEWYSPPYVAQWMKDKDEGQRAWLVRPRQGGAELVARWRETGIVSLVARHLAEVPADSSLAQVGAAVEAGYQHQDYAQRLALTQEYHAFLSRMKTDDVVVTLAEDRMSVGIVLGEPRYDADELTRLNRPVAWVQQSVPLVDLPVPMPSLLDQQGTVVDLTSAMDVVASFLAPVDTEGPGLPPPIVDVIPRLPAITDAVANKLHIPVQDLQDIVDLLQVRQQIVFYGPPGTGKTFIAQALAKHLVGGDDPSRAQLVQFHPSYSYEDFFEGYRPAESPTGQAIFRLTPGPLSDLAAEAGRESNRGTPYVLVIDEMNRANIAKVFGELYFLLEYRDESIRLQYRPGDVFRLPKNLFVIGTMNTADRSIAALDAALRRRFSFVELHPDEPPVRDVLASWLAANGKDDDERSGLLKALNAAIEDQDRDFRLGPSYLMRTDAETEAGLRRVWRYDVLPQLEEHYYGRLSRAEIHQRFGLGALRRVVARRAGDEVATLAAETDDLEE